MQTIPCDRVSKSPLASRSQCSGPVKQISCVPGLVLWLHNFDKQRSDARHTAPDRTYLSRWDEDLKASTRAKQFKFDLFCVGDSAGRNGKPSHQPSTLSADCFFSSWLLPAGSHHARLFDRSHGIADASPQAFKPRGCTATCWHACSQSTPRRKCYPVKRLIDQARTSPTA